MKIKGQKSSSLLSEGPVQATLASALFLLDSVGKELGLQLISPDVASDLENSKISKAFEQWIRSEYKSRSKRSVYFPNLILGEPCWDMLLDLARAAMENREITVSSVYIASGVPPTTALRWLKIMTDDGFVKREADSSDGRKTIVRITDMGMNALERYYRDCIATG